MNPAAKSKQPRDKLAVPFLDLGRQTALLRPRIEAAIARVLDRGRFILDEELAAFEGEFAAFTGARQTIGVGNGTQALEIALRTCGIGEGSEVITSPLSAPFTAQAIHAAGARAVFADVDPDTLLLDPAAAAKVITRRTRAIMPVHLYGRVANMQAFADLAHAHKIEVIQDACQAHGARYQGKALTRWSRWVAYSFYPTKNLGALGDGGALSTDDDGQARLARLLRTGGVKSCSVSERIAINSRLDEMQAAILREKLHWLEKGNRRRCELARIYSSRVGKAVGGDAPRGEHVYHLYVVRHRSRSALREHLSRHGIGTAIHYPQPLHRQPAFRTGKPLPLVERACREIVSLPLDPTLSVEDIERVCDAFTVFGRRTG